MLRAATAAFALGTLVFGVAGSTGARAPSTTGVDPLITVSVRISDTRLTVKPARVARLETVQFRVVNTGKLTHDFRVGGLKSRKLKPGQVDHVLLQFADRGTYLYRCVVNCSAKMRGFMVVYSPIG
jgi:plastocyanin